MGRRVVFIYDAGQSSRPYPSLASLVASTDATQGGASWQVPDSLHQGNTLRHTAIPTGCSYSNSSFHPSKPVNPVMSETRQALTLR